jgi:transcriptional/translational regulatory protein YebC/TACO1
MQAYAYGGAGFIINCLTDNTNRAKTEINNALKKTEAGSLVSVRRNYSARV